MSSFNIGVYGIGNFGFAILKHLSNKKFHHKLYCFDRNSDVLNSIFKEYRHPFLHNRYKFNKNINVCFSPSEIIGNVDLLILCVTSDAVLDIANQVKKYSKKKIIILNTAKALDKISGDLISSIFDRILNNFQYEYGMLAGGTIASDLFKQEPLGVNIATQNSKTQILLREVFSSENLRVYLSSDVIGVEYAAAFKNVIAILAGIVHGSNYSFGSETHLISRASGEVENLVVNYLGGDRATFSMDSQCWGNDLWMSCLGDSRNRKLGILIAKNNSFAKGIKKAKTLKITVEGVNSIYALEKLVGMNHEKFPILKNITALPHTKPDEIIKKILKI